MSILIQYSMYLYIFLFTKPLKSSTLAADFNKNEKMILTYLETHDWLTNAAAREIVHVGTTAARSLLNGLVDRGYLRAEGENRGRKYYLAEKRPR